MGESWWTLVGTTFVVVFVAELGDKTQLAALGLATAGKHPWAVFLGSALALVLASALAVGVGKLLADRINPRWLHYAGASLFLVIGVAMFVRGPATSPPGPDATNSPSPPGAGTPGD